MAYVELVTGTIVEITETQLKQMESQLATYPDRKRTFGVPGKEVTSMERHIVGLFKGDIPKVVRRKKAGK